ncbi:MAG: hypothetical protein Q7W45_08855 [Bacteroidota bacterium]|nr:hypothetical protein [Bacteroidota bacterium]MDP3144214.1 hypothetical protein [Bacteroidota bacterium]
MKKLFAETLKSAIVINLKTISHLTCDIILRSDHIIKIEFKEVEELKLDHVIDIFNIIQPLAPVKKCLILISLANYINPSVEVREFWAAKERNEISLAEAILINNLPMTLIVNFYLNINKPQRPTKIFKNETDAIDWLKHVT